MRNLAAIILAAGKGTRMKSAMPKVLHECAGLPMLSYPVKALKDAGVKKIIVVVGHSKDDVIERFRSEKITFVEQKEQLGTGHAVMCAMKALRGFKGGVLILSGDVPLITVETLKALKNLHCKGSKILSLITAVPVNPAGYGRIVRDENNAVIGVVEDKDASSGQKKIREINTGIYLISSGFLFANIKKIGSANAQKEYYLPDLVRLAVKGGSNVKALTLLDPEEAMGINNRVELAKASAIMRLRIVNELMLSGVTFIHPETAYVENFVKIGPDAIIHPSVHLGGQTVIAQGCVIEQGAVIRNSHIGKNSVIKSSSVIDASVIGEGAAVGPFARIRPGTVLENHAHIGNFVEIKKSVIGKGTKANHLSYIGDAVVGANVNIGAGAITCNYDGFKKHVTIIEDDSFIGSDSQLVAPVRIGKGAYVGSGTTVTKDVPPGALVITRADEKIIKGWVKKRRKK
ncbi:MAG: bifunctional UDP-N-acetylglucosamine diphosphorylase/glucosamine-1-phosphate N-acetyltransferase GlmU [Deltaproteobacteria bacterium]|nr:bifunctional UDP-N-acetylglucosamine diphosphorylase/glucosamine-1-phosphate N-acetyltransferase GlmU [Deltaproteobacteria bacterium]